MRCATLLPVIAQKRSPMPRPFFSSVSSSPFVRCTRHAALLHSHATRSRVSFAVFSSYACSLALSPSRSSFFFFALLQFFLCCPSLAYSHEEGPSLHASGSPTRYAESRVTCVLVPPFSLFISGAHPVGCASQQTNTRTTTAAATGALARCFPSLALRILLLATPARDLAHTRPRLGRDWVRSADHLRVCLVCLYVGLRVCCGAPSRRRRLPRAESADATR